MILQKENKDLRKAAEKSAEIKHLIGRMAEAMFKEPDGVGIAAPQIGESLRVFLVAKDIFAPLPERDGKEKKERQKEYLAFINPVMKKYSQKKSKDIEGCLSVRGFYGEVQRPEKIFIEYIDESGKKHARGASGLFARVIQHELDHLEGVLFIDKAKNIKRLDFKHEK